MFASEHVGSDLLTLIAMGLGLTALPYVIAIIVGSAIGLVLAIVFGAIAFIGWQFWRVVEPVVVPAAVLIGSGLVIVTRLAILSGLLWLGFKALAWFAFGASP